MKSLLVSAALVAAFCCPAFAQDATATCQTTTVEKLLSDMAKPPVGIVMDNLKVKAALFDQAIVIQYEGHEFLWFAKDGCVVAKPLYLGDVPGATPTAAPKPSALIFDNHA